MLLYSFESLVLNEFRERSVTQAYLKENIKTQNIKGKTGILHHVKFELFKSIISFFCYIKNFIIRKEEYLVITEQNARFAKILNMHPLI